MSPKVSTHSSEKYLDFEVEETKKSMNRSGIEPDDIEEIDSPIVSVAPIDESKPEFIDFRSRPTRRFCDTSVFTC